MQILSSFCKVSRGISVNKKQFKVLYQVSVFLFEDFSKW